ncbi:MAG: ATP-binding protein [Deltaproteobacteria bacterium]|nr:ATP-binding protein [Deltaproteobacteria bacterium]
MFQRIIKPIKSNSFFLFGARGTGKSTFLKSFFEGEKTLWIDLLDPLQEEEYAKNPGLFFSTVEAQKNRIRWVVVDEVQKLPKLLDSVHRLIESSPVLFALTGSSARKLKRGAANLLAGRAFLNNLFPLTHVEMGEAFSLEKALHFGALPKAANLSRIQNSKEEPNAFLKTYAITYLKEEVWAEHVVRKLDPFRKFLEIAAQCNGSILNYSNIALDTGVDVKTVQSYFEILEDTLVGSLLQPYHRSIRKQQRQNPKFYFFDTGIKRALEGTLEVPLLPQTYAYGRAFEHWLIIEMMRLNDYKKTDFRFYYLLTKDGAEIDLIVERPGLPDILIEIKSSNRVDERDTQTVEKFLRDFNRAEAYCFSNDPTSKKIGSVLALHWQKGLQEIGLA